MAGTSSIANIERLPHDHSITCFFVNKSVQRKTYSKY